MSPTTGPPLPLAAEWSTVTVVAVAAYVAVSLGVACLTIWMACRHNPGAPQRMGKAGGQLITFASLLWPLWACFVLPRLWSEGERRAASQRRTPSPPTPAPAPPAGAGARCGRCGDRVGPDDAARPWGRLALCGRCARDLAVD